MISTTHPWKRRVLGLGSALLSLVLLIGSSMADIVRLPSEADLKVATGGLIPGVYSSGGLFCEECDDIPWAYGYLYNHNNGGTPLEVYFDCSNVQKVCSEIDYDAEDWIIPQDCDQL